jgi:superfamily II DNA/RNA helicase
VNYDFTMHPEDYVHRIGRTGRAHAAGDAISFIAPEDQGPLHSLERFIGRGIVRKVSITTQLPRRKERGGKRRRAIAALRRTPVRRLSRQGQPTFSLGERRRLVPRYIAFLRAVNVGGHLVKMERLRREFESLGFAKVETLICERQCHLRIACAGRTTPPAENRDPSA